MVTTLLARVGVFSYGGEQKRAIAPQRRAERSAELCLPERGLGQGDRRAERIELLEVARAR